MKVAIASDLHIEFGRFDIKNEHGAELLILSGDIIVAQKMHLYSINFKDFFHQVQCEFPNTVYVMGNHEHYHGDFAHTEDDIRDFLSAYPSVNLLEKQSVTINGYPIFGATFWTDMNGEDFNTIREARHEMNDYALVKNSTNSTTFRTETGEFKKRYSKFIPHDSISEFKKTIEKLNEFLEQNKGKNVIVVSHHAPSKHSVHPRHGDSLLNGAYSSNLSHIMKANPNIKLWTHGHTHSDWDYVIEETRVVCNPRGYIMYESRADNFSLKYLDIS
jgi:Icc-related predicted phosphoesterase